MELGNCRLLPLYHSRICFNFVMSDYRLSVCATSSLNLPLSDLFRNTPVGRAKNKGRVFQFLAEKFKLKLIARVTRVAIQYVDTIRFFA